jgi:hypothetical protein
MAAWMAPTLPYHWDFFQTRSAQHPDFSCGGSYKIWAPRLYQTGKTADGELDSVPYLSPRASRSFAGRKLLSIAPVRV